MSNAATYSAATYSAAGFSAKAPKPLPKPLVKLSANGRAGKTQLRQSRVPRWRRDGCGVIGVAAVAAVTVWIGLEVDAQPLPEDPAELGEVATTRLPSGLPLPVERFYTELYGEQIPVVDTAVIIGRGEMRISGLTFPARWRFSHLTGQAYSHYIELTVFGRRLMTVNESYVDGRARLDLPVGISEGPNIDQGANLALWAEAVWMPSLWVQHPAVRREAIDENSARLIVPFEGGEEAFSVWFDPETGLLNRLESMRFKGEQDSRRTLWINEVLAWGEVDGHPVPLETAITWGDEDPPWAILCTEGVKYNSDLRIVP